MNKDEALAFKVGVCNGIMDELKVVIDDIEKIQKVESEIPWWNMPKIFRSSKALEKKYVRLEVLTEMLHKFRKGV